MEELPESKTPSFEEAYSRLDAIVKSLDAGRGGLEEALANYEQGIALLKICREKLDGASRKIEQLKGVDEQGNPVLEALKEEDLKSQADSAGRQSAASYAESQNVTVAKVETSGRRANKKSQDSAQDSVPVDANDEEDDQASDDPLSADVPEPKRSPSRSSKKKESKIDSSKKDHTFFDFDGSQPPF